MKKFFSLIKVSLSHDMNIFKLNTKKQGKISKTFLPILLMVYFMILLGYYSNELIKVLKPVNMEFVVITLFALLVSTMTLFEGIYKSGSLIFNCKDDNLLLSLPIKKNTVLFIRIFKFYVFELLYNSLFILPAMVMYAINVNPTWSYYLSSFIALFLLPIVPVVLSCIIGFVVAFISSKFKGKNIFQTIFTTLFLLTFLYLSFNMEGFVSNLAKTASDINELITKLYYPVGAYISIINDFSISKLMTYIFVNIIILFVIVYALGKVYYIINSGFKQVLTSHKKNNYVIKTSSKTKSFVKKELNKFFSTPVFITNAGFSLVLFIIVCIISSLKFDSIASSMVKTNPNISLDFIKKNLPIIMFAIVSFASFMTSITSSMISLEGKFFSLLKSLPIKPIKIVLYKVITALIIMIPCIIIGDIIIFIRFKFDFISVLLILIASILLPMVSELIGIIVNLKYPRIDANNDTEVVKQSISSLISTFSGMVLFGITIVLLFTMLDKGISNNIIMLIFLGFYGIVCVGLWLILNRICDKSFKNINA